MSHLKRTVRLERKCTQRTNDTVIKKQLDYIMSRALGSTRGACWDYKIRRPAPVKQGDNWVFEAHVKLEKTKGRTTDDIVQRQYEAIMEFMARTCEISKFGRFPWQIKAADQYEPSYEPDTTPNSTIKDYAAVSAPGARAWHYHLSHIYERDAQIRVVTSALEAAIASDFKNRFHCVLHGPPACGKSDILVGIAKALGEEGEAFLKIDATSTTEAGISKLLLEADTVPPVLIVEEIEKADPGSLRWLLGVLDHRAEVRRINARIGNQARNVQLLCLATVNDLRAFEAIASGALASRFSLEVHCPRPSEAVLRRILQREVDKVGGKAEWVEPTLRLAEVLGVNDPRKIIPLCLCGGDRLLDGSYQADIRAVRGGYV